VSSDSVTDPYAELMAERYGRRPGGKWRVRVAAAAGVAVLVAGVSVVFWWSQSGPGQIQPTVTGFHVTSASSITVSFTVTKPAGTKISCTVIGEDELSSTVGSTVVTIPAAGSEASETVTLPTLRRAVTGIVQSCRATG
jgi:hypothetical protein